MPLRKVVLLAFALALVAAACGSRQDSSQPVSTVSAASAEVGGGGGATDDSPLATPASGSEVPSAETGAAEQNPTTSAALPAGRTTPVSVPGVYSDVAVVGCSQTRDAMFGYFELSDRGILGDRGEARYLSGGSIERWTTQSDNPFYWDEFARWNGAESDAVWIQV